MHHTCVLHLINAHFDKVGHRRVLPLAQTAQTAAENLIWKHQEQHRFDLKPRKEDEWRFSSMAAVVGATFDITLVSNSLIGGPANQELLQLHPGFLLVRGVHTQRGLHHCGRCAGIESGFLQDVTNHKPKQLWLGSPLFFLESRCSFSLSCFSAPGDSGMSSSMASSDSQA